MNQNDNNHTNNAHENLHTIELPQHRSFDEEGNTRNNDECIMYAKLLNLSAHLVIVVLHNKS